MRTLRRVLLYADNLARSGDLAGAARALEAAAHHVHLHAPFALAGDSARAFCWPHALEADALGQRGDLGVLRALADTLAHVGERSYYGRDWRLFHHVRGLIAAREQRWPDAIHEFEAARWGALGWNRTTAELAMADLAAGNPRAALDALRLAHRVPLDAMGRYLPHSEIDWRMAQAFQAAGMTDSARTYAGYVRRAWAEADAPVRARLAGLPH